MVFRKAAESLKGILLIYGAKLTVSQNLFIKDVNPPTFSDGAKVIEKQYKKSRNNY